MHNLDEEPLYIDSGSVSCLCLLWVSPVGAEELSLFACVKPFLILADEPFTYPSLVFCSHPVASNVVEWPFTSACRASACAFPNAVKDDATRHSLPPTP
ncbi:hypothetical protein B0H13DRAFT_2358557 [Mycena leptocephala]|nr:hypothetical protein B0H13DRAFT_2358557 [Mycena leptocephala]